MKEIEQLKQSTFGQLGSLEDTSQVKRLDPAKIRRLRAQTQEQTAIRFSFIRFVARFWYNFNSSLALLFIRPTSVCAKNGHIPVPANGMLRCRNCNAKISQYE